MTDKFDEFIKSQTKKAAAGDTEQITPEREKELWLNKLIELYTLVDKSLNTYVKSGDVTIARVPVVLNEDQLGSYKADQLEITIGRQLVRLKPVGTFLIGARGRVDMVGPRGSVRFLVVPPASNKPTFKVIVSIAGEERKTPGEPEHIPFEEWVWKIATLPPQITYLNLTSESFREALVKVVNGNT